MAVDALVFAAVLVPAVVVTVSVQAQTFSVLHQFTGAPSDGAYPQAGLVRDARGNLYGTTLRGGNVCGGLGCGTVFEVDKKFSETVLYKFMGSGGDGEMPQAGVVRDTQGNIYGTTYVGGASGDGTVFKVDSTGSETVWHSFGNSPDGAVPYAGLVQDAEGNLYGATSGGGDSPCDAPYGCGTVFKVDTMGNETVLYRFTGTGGDGEQPWSGLVQDRKGHLYGTTRYGGTSGNGTVFKVDTTGNETVLLSRCT